MLEPHQRRQPSRPGRPLNRAVAAGTTSAGACDRIGDGGGSDTDSGGAAGVADGLGAGSSAGAGAGSSEGAGAAFGGSGCADDGSSSPRLGRGISGSHEQLLGTPLFAAVDQPPGLADLLASPRGGPSCPGVAPWSSLSQQATAHAASPRSMAAQVAPFGVAPSLGSSGADLQALELQRQLWAAERYTALHGNSFSTDPQQCLVGPCAAPSMLQPRGRRRRHRHAAAAVGADGTLQEQEAVPAQLQVPEGHAQLPAGARYAEAEDGQELQASLASPMGDLQRLLHGLGAGPARPDPQDLLGVALTGSPALPVVPQPQPAQRDEAANEQQLQPTSPAALSAILRPLPRPGVGPARHSPHGGHGAMPATILLATAAGPAGLGPWDLLGAQPAGIPAQERGPQLQPHLRAEAADKQQLPLAQASPTGGLGARPNLVQRLGAVRGPFDVAGAVPPGSPAQARVPQQHDEPHAEEADEQRLPLHRASLAAALRAVQRPLQGAGAAPAGRDGRALLCAVPACSQHDALSLVLGTALRGHIGALGTTGVGNCLQCSASQNAYLNGRTRSATALRLNAAGESVPLVTLHTYEDHAPRIRSELADAILFAEEDTPIGRFVRHYTPTLLSTLLGMLKANPWRKRLLECTTAMQQAAAGTAHKAFAKHFRIHSEDGGECFGTCPVHTWLMCHALHGTCMQLPIMHLHAAVCL